MLNAEMCQSDRDGVGEGLFDQLLAILTNSSQFLPTPCSFDQLLAVANLEKQMGGRWDVGEEDEWWVQWAYTTGVFGKTLKIWPIPGKF